ncbi:MAG: YbgC/FadM family acyl-CoA thioesterase [Burkholderiaceae bacterium]
MTRSDFRFAERLRVRWAEIDAQQIVFNGHYLMYFDTAIAGFWRRMALPYHETMRALEGDLYVRKATLEYLSSARYDDLVDVGVRCERIGNSSIQFDCGVFRQAELLVSGTLIYVFADPVTQSSKPLPGALREWLLAFEAKAAMVNVRLGRWSDLEVDARRVRTQVFIEEQAIAQDMEWDASDADAVHAVAYNKMGMALGTGRAFVDSGGEFRIGRMAVIASMRGTGIGRMLLESLIQTGRTRGVTRVGLSAQTSAARFYARAGFAEQGGVFDDAGIPHIEMTRAISPDLGPA